VFTAPITGTLDSFTLWLNGPVVRLHGAVGLWNGTSTYQFGKGESTNLYTSGSVASVGGGQQAYTFAPGINVTKDTLYVAYLSLYGEGLNPGIAATMPLGTNVSGIDYFVWNNTSNPKNNPSWNYFFSVGDVQFEATFSPPGGVIPEPTSMAVFAGIFGTFAAFGCRSRRRRS
jgi:hypothetical protein